MTTQTFKLDCTSPLLNYQAPNAWRRGGFDGDPDAIRSVSLSSWFYPARANLVISRRPRYDNSTFNFADVTGATLSFNFTGTFVQIIGAYRVNDGPFTYVLLRYHLATS